MSRLSSVDINQICFLAQEGVHLRDIAEQYCVHVSTVRHAIKRRGVRPERPAFISLEGEEWRPTEHPAYEVSNLGRVRSYFVPGGDTRSANKLTACLTTDTPRLLQPGAASNGYPTVCLGRGKTHQVHALVAAAFLGPCPPGQEVRHKDDNRNNPVASNLEYGTRSDNIRDMMLRHPRRYKLSGVVPLIRRLLRRHSYREIATFLKLNPQTIYRIANGDTWACV